MYFIISLYSNDINHYYGKYHYYPVLCGVAVGFLRARGPWWVRSGNLLRFYAKLGQSKLLYFYGCDQDTKCSQRVVRGLCACDEI